MQIGCSQKLTAFLTSPSQIHCIILVSVDERVSISHMNKIKYTLAVVFVGFLFTLVVLHPVI